MIIYILLTVVLVAAYLYVKKKLSHFERYGIKHLPTNFVFGNLYQNLRKKEHFFNVITRAYNAFPNDRFVGFYEFLVPIYLIKDVDLLKKITVKDFDHFMDHRPFSHENEQFFSKSLFALKGEKWRDMRSTLSPAFTASKLRSMVPLIQKCSTDSAEYLKNDIEQSKDGKLDIDVKDFISRIATDVIATCAYGLQTNSISERDNEFFKMGTILTNFSFLQTMKFMFASSFPTVSKMLNLSVFPDVSVSFYTKIFLETLKRRQEENIYRPDMLQLLLEVKKGTLTSDTNVHEDKDAGYATAIESDMGKSTKKYEWDDSYLVAQAIIFFLAGFETISTTITCLLHELAVNPDIQDRLREEIYEFLKESQGKLDYNQLNRMKLLDNCISETLRKWPPTGTLERICLKDYDLGKPSDDAPNFIIPKDAFITIPVMSIQYDEKYYPNPHKFDPDRFSDDNKHNINAFTFMPFGVGPRNCIGSRFALIEVKTIIIDILSRFEVSPSATTKIPLRLDRSTFNYRFYGGHTLTISARKSQN